MIEQSEPMADASGAALLTLHAEWDSTECPVCKAEKWAHYPFCRSCSIKLQRMHLMQPLVPWRSLSGDQIMQGGYIVPSGKMIWIDDDYGKVTQLWRWFRSY